MYNEKTIDHFSNPRNMGEIKNADFIGEGGNPTCGDVVKLFIKLNDKKDTIEDIKFMAFGCGACIASTSALTEMVKGEKISKAISLTNNDIADYLGGIPPQKMICSNFSADILKKALKEQRA